MSVFHNKGLNSTIILKVADKITQQMSSSLYQQLDIDEWTEQVTFDSNSNFNTPKSSTQVIKTGENKWGLKSTTWNIPKAAADYYLLQLAVLIDEKFRPYLDKHTGMLVDQFARYTDMAIGGEIRHVYDKSSMIKRLREAIDNDVLYGSRNSAWEGWYWFRQQYGTLALRWLVNVYNEDWRWKPGYGGEAWGKIANTLLMFEDGEITPHSFVDTCWGLEHNGGGYFDKWWETMHIKKILDLNQNGHYCYLLQQASHMVQKLMPEESVKELCLCGIHSGE